MASIFDKISNKAGDTRKSSTWYRNAVASIADTVTARKLYNQGKINHCLLYTSPSPRDRTRSRMPSSA